MKTMLWLIVYLTAAILVLTIHQLSPTNLAGPGFDIVVYLLAILGAIGMLAKNLTKSTGTATSLRLLNIFGSLAILLLTICTFFK